MCVCERERERETERKGQKERERQLDGKRKKRVGRAVEELEVRVLAVLAPHRCRLPKDIYIYIHVFIYVCTYI